MQQSLFATKTKKSKACGAGLLGHLNEAQQEAATAMDGPVLVIAGAGSGKTRTLVYRLAHLVEQGIDPSGILLLTFTRKAAQEMLHRAGLLLDRSCQQVTGGTFHAVANMLLRRYGRHLGYGPNFTILDQADAEGIVNLLKSSLNLGGESRRFPSRRVVAAILSKAVNKGVPLEEVVENEYSHLVDFIDDLLVIQTHYHRFKMEHGLMDYDDLLVNWRLLLAGFPEVREELSGRFSHIMVDEYQDTNPIQAEIVRLMARPRNNVMVVGDDSQSIYSFRGADFRNIMDFPSLFPSARVIRLEENYRSSQSILDVTNAIIERAREKYSKTLFSSIRGGEKPVVHGARDEGAQARWVAEKILALRDSGEPMEEIAVLFRSGFHSYKLELELAGKQIDFEKRGGLRLTESAHIKDVLAYLRIVANPHDHLSWNRLLLQLDKVGPRSAEKILERIKSAEDPLAALAGYPAGKAWRAGFASLLEVLASLRRPGLTPKAMFDLVREFYQPVFERLYYDDFPRRSRDLDQVGLIIAGYDALQPFLDDASLDPPQVESEQGQGSGGRGRLVLSTIHSAKGLEWNTVFVINLAEGKFPASQTILPEQVEEERRLFYVAATRARKRLFLLYPQEVVSLGGQRGDGGISPFLAEIPQALVQTAGGAAQKVFPEQSPAGHPVRAVASPGGESAGKRQPGPCVPAPGAALCPGARVRHQFFGPGVVVRNTGPRSVEVSFQGYGKKVLHLDYARLEICP